MNAEQAAKMRAGDLVRFMGEPDHPIAVIIGFWDDLTSVQIRVRSRGRWGSYKVFCTFLDLEPIIKIAGFEI